jgi:hypothetical protein
MNDSQINVILPAGHQAVDDDYGLVGGIVDSDENALPGRPVDLDGQPFGKGL